MGGTHIYMSKTTIECKIEGCDRLGELNKNGNRYLKKGYCGMHYQRHLKHGDPLYDVKPTRCKIERCPNKGAFKDGRYYFTKGYCSSHYEKVKKYGDPFFRKVASPNGRSRHQLNKTYFNIKQRCYYPGNVSYPLYGGRGIKMCDRWLGIDGFSSFIEDMGERPSTSHTVDRIDSDGNYTPDNCRWATRHQQQANMRSNNETVGVSKKGSIYNAQLMVDKVVVLNRNYKSKQQAIKARKNAEREYNITI